MRTATAADVRTLWLAEHVSDSLPEVNPDEAGGQDQGKQSE
jgi:hypothetical protein